MCRDCNNNNNNKNSSMTPLEDHEKSIPSRKRQRQRRQQQGRGVKSSFLDGDDELGADLLRDEEVQLTLEVASLKHAVGRMQSQVAAASAQLKELKALVAALMHHRRPALEEQELKRRRVDA